VSIPVLLPVLPRPTEKSTLRALVELRLTSAEQKENTENGCAAGWVMPTSNGLESNSWSMIYICRASTSSVLFISIFLSTRRASSSTYILFSSYNPAIRRIFLASHILHIATDQLSYESKSEGGRRRDRWASIVVVGSSAISHTNWNLTGPVSSWHTKCPGTTNKLIKLHEAGKKCYSSFSPFPLLGSFAPYSRRWPLDPSAVPWKSTEPTGTRVLLCYWGKVWVLPSLHSLLGLSK
jgi:hypothetical protein